MKKALLTLIIIGASYSPYAQTNIYEFGTSVGIGISNPSGKLEVLGQQNQRQNQEFKKEMELLKSKIDRS